MASLSEHLPNGGNDGDDDEFGDTNWLMEVDVDRIEAAATERSVTNPSSSQQLSRSRTESRPVLGNENIFNNVLTTREEDKDGNKNNGRNDLDLPSSKRLKHDNPTQNQDYRNLNDSLRRCLQHYYGFTDFRTGQEDVIRALLDGHDATVFWATGQGKSIVYQLLPLFLSSCSWKSSSLSSSSPSGIGGTSSGTCSTCIVISPLISLIQDQVHKLNGLLSSSSLSTDDSDSNNHHQPFPIATYLGSAQTNACIEERRVLDGQYKLVYMTPEKFSSMMDRLEERASSSSSRDGLNICCIAFDEAHCVSQWGNDFRPQYKQVGQILRSTNTSASPASLSSSSSWTAKTTNRARYPTLAKVPIVALTATATPQIRMDVVQTLQLRPNATFQSMQSFDRSNLALSVKMKDTNSSTRLEAAMGPLIRSLSSQSSSQSLLSPTIIYTVTRDEADTVASFLQQRFMAVEQSKKEVTSPNDVATSPTYQSTVIVEAYHAGMDPRKRHDVHVRFLTGRVHVVVATVAFGMGIDMPNIRKVVHWGPPKTVEDYYQQVGRAGRDGLQSECIMYCSPSEFDRYLDDFYLPEHPDARLASIKSTKALKSFALDKDGCRRKALLDFFQQDNNNAPFGDRCGTCDNCLAQKQYGNDTQRNFSAEIRLILTAVSALRDPSLSSMEAVLAGKIVDGYRYERGVRPTELQSQMVSKRKDLPKTTQSVVVLKGLVPLIVQKGLLEEATKTSSSGAFTRTWTVFSVTPKGQKILGESNTTTPSVIMLPVPDSIREAEHQQKLRREQTLRNLTAGGVNLANIPSHELEEGDGDAIRAFTKWSSYVATQEKLGRDERALKLKQLLSSVESWRSDAALKLTMSPVSVLPEQIMLSIVYTAATLTPGIKIEKSSLLAAGVRTRELDSLLKTLNDWIDSCVEDSKQKKPVGEDCEISDDPIVFPNGVVQPAQQWQFAVYKPNKKTGKATWEFSYDRFQLQKESPQTIAMSPSNGRPIQVSTVVGHILDGLLLGRPVDMYRLAPFCHEIPRRSHWIQLDLAAETTGIDVRGDPAHSGVGGGPFRLSDLLRPIMGDEFIDAPKEERSDEDKVKFGQWCNASKWYLALKRAGIEPAFGL